MSGPVEVEMQPGEWVLARSDAAQYATGGVLPDGSPRPALDYSCGYHLTSYEAAQRITGGQP